MIIDGHRVLACFITIFHSITQYQSLFISIIFHINPQQKKFVAISRDEIKSSVPFLLPPTPKQTRPHTKRNS
jgi:hypothetical protein